MTSNASPSLGTVGVVIVGAGRGIRMAGVDKVFVRLRGLPVIGHSIRTFATLREVSRIAIVLSEERMREARRLITAFGMGKASMCVGGERRQDSVRAGLEALGECDYVVVHDAARPMVDAAIVRRGLKAVTETGAAVCAVPATDTIKVVSDEGDVLDTPPRDSLWQVQTPQVFRYDTLMSAHEQCNGDFTDDAAMVESMGVGVKVFVGSYRNVKVTTPEDLVVVEALMRTPRGGTFR